MRRRPLQLALGTPVLALMLTLTGCAGGSAPSSVEDQAAKLAGQQLSRLSPAPSATLTDTEWEMCKQELPITPRSATFRRVERLQVAAADAKQVIAALTSSWRSAGYTIDEPWSGSFWTQATAPNNTHWTYRIGVLPDDGHLYLAVYTDCFDISSDPTTGEQKH